MAAMAAPRENTTQRLCSTRKLQLAAFITLLSAVSSRSDAGCCWCDGDTPTAAVTTSDSDGLEHELVFSDEFEMPDRDFANGRDRRWTAINKSDYTNGSPMRYMPEAVTTVVDRGAFVRISSNVSVDGKVWRAYPRPYGSLRITTSNITADERLAKAVNKTFAGGMLQSWNKVCFTGGIIEIAAKMPAGSGFWPALWLFGNLGRAIHKETNDGLWPYSLTECDPAYEARPVPEPGLKQRISGCDANPGPGLHPLQGRGATEIDIAEVADSPNGAQGWLTMSLQAAPALPSFFRPPQGEFPRPAPRKGQPEPISQTWYRGLRFGGNASGLPPAAPFRNWYGAPYADAVACEVSPLQGLSERYRTYRLEWLDGEGGHLRWSIDGVFVFEIPAQALGKYTACGQSPSDEELVCEHSPRRAMPSEPMSIVLNSALGTWNGGAEAARGSLPGHLYVDYVRVWQRAGRKNVGCDPPDFPTAEYIERHAHLYGEKVLPASEDSCAPIYPKATRAHRARAKGSREGGRLGTGAGLGVLAVGLACVGWMLMVRLRRAASLASASSHYSSVVRQDSDSSMRIPMLARTGSTSNGTVSEAPLRREASQTGPRRISAEAAVTARSELLAQVQ